MHKAFVISALVVGLLVPATAAATSSPRERTLLRRQWGIEVVFVRQSSAGYMLEFRYKVHDAELAKPLFAREDKPLLIHEESGAQMSVPTPTKTGALRNSNEPLDDHVYWMFFANPGVFVKKGDTVTIQIGDFKVEGLVVQ